MALAWPSASFRFDDSNDAVLARDSGNQSPLCDFTVFRFSRATILPPEQEKTVRVGRLDFVVFRRSFHLFDLRSNTTRLSSSKSAEGDCATKEMAVVYWAKAMTVETGKVVQQNRDKAMQKELEMYMRHAIGRKPTGSLYATTMHRR